MSPKFSKSRPHLPERIRGSLKKGLIGSRVKELEALKQATVELPAEAVDVLADEPSRTESPTDSTPGRGLGRQHVDVIAHEPPQGLEARRVDRPHAHRRAEMTPERERHRHIERGVAVRAGVGFREEPAAATELTVAISHVSRRKMSCSSMKTSSSSVQRGGLVVHRRDVHSVASPSTALAGPSLRYDWCRTTARFSGTWTAPS